MAEKSHEVKEIIQQIWEVFTEDFNVKGVIDKVFSRRIINTSVRDQITKTTDDKEATRSFLTHLEKNATIETLQKLHAILLETVQDHERHQSLADILRDRLPAPQSVGPVSSHTDTLQQMAKRSKLMRLRKRMAPSGMNQYQSRAKRLSVKEDPREKFRRRFRSHICIQTMHNDRSPEDVIKGFYGHVCVKLAHTLNNYLSIIKMWINSQRALGLHPYDALGVEEISEYDSVDKVFQGLGIDKSWINTTLLVEIIFQVKDVNPSYVHEAEIWLEEYKKIVKDYAQRVFFTSIPEEHRKQLEKPETPSKSFECLTAIYNIDYRQFSVGDLLCETEYLSKILGIPLQKLHFSQAKESQSTSVLWQLPQHCAGPAFLKVQEQFWCLLEHKVLMVEFVGMLKLVLKGTHVVYLIRNALYQGKDLLKDTEVFTPQFNAIVDTDFQKIWKESKRNLEERKYRQYLEASAKQLWESVKSVQQSNILRPFESYDGEGFGGDEKPPISLEEDFDSTYHDVILQPEDLTEVDYPFPTDESECEPMEAVIMSDFERTAVKGPGEKSRTDSNSKGFDPRNLALVCQPCLEELSSFDSTPSIETCVNSSHVKKMMVKKGSVFTTVRRRDKKMLQLCKAHPFCKYGDDCRYAHSELELKFWKGQCIAKYETCLDCMWSKAMDLCKNQCLTGMHKLSVVVYPDDKTKHLLEVRRPINLKAMVDKQKRYTCWHVRDECKNENCQHPHNDIECAVWNKWKTECQSEFNAHEIKTFLDITQQLFAKVGPKKSEGQSNAEDISVLLLKEELTNANYKSKFALLIENEKSAHEAHLKRNYDGEYEFRKGTDDPDHKLEKQLEKSKCRSYGCLLIDSTKADFLRQAATHVKFPSGSEKYDPVILQWPVSVKLNDKFQSAVFLGFKGDHKIPERQLSVQFVLKYGYFKNLKQAVKELSSAVLHKLTPTKNHFKHPSKHPEFNYDSIELPEQFNLDAEYQKPACRKLFCCRSDAPFLITGPFGTGKTRLLATAALRLLLSDSKQYRILISTHHQKTADEYITKYFGPFLDCCSKRQKDKIRLLRLVRNNDSQQSVRGKFHKYALAPESVDSYNLIVTTFILSMQKLRLKKGEHLSHIFIDEGAQAREPECVAAFTLANRSTKIVIAGDHLQVGPRTSVRGDIAQNHGLAVSIVERLHRSYHLYDHEQVANPYHALLLTNYRCHPTILSLPSSAFYNCNLQARSTCQHHPDWKQTVHFVCTSLQQYPKCIWSDVAVLYQAALDEIQVVLEWVKKCAQSWPEAEWGKKDLSSLCVVTPNKFMERQWNHKARNSNLTEVTSTVAYDIQGREYKAVFICTSEAVTVDCKSCDTTKSLCDPFVFNTVITRASSLVVAVGNPFRLMEIEKRSQLSPDCWSAYLNRCMQHKSLVLSYKLNKKRCTSANKKDFDEAQIKLEELMFQRVGDTMKDLITLPKDVGDSIIEAYNKSYKDKNARLVLGKVGGDLGWKIGDMFSGEIKTPGKASIDSAEIECHLWQQSVKECVCVPMNPRERKIYIHGLDDRRMALDGAIVEVIKLNTDKNKPIGRVVRVKEQGCTQSLVCELSRYNKNICLPVDHKSPRLVNLPHVSRHVLEQTDRKSSKQYPFVVCFDPKSLNQDSVPKIVDVIPFEIAQNLLFIVHPLSWSPKYRFPLGAIVGVLPRGTTQRRAEEIISIGHLLPSLLNIDSSLEAIPRFISSSSSSCLRYAIGVVHHCFSDLAFTVESDIYTPDKLLIGIHVPNVADSVSTSTTFKDCDFKLWASLSGCCQGKSSYSGVLPSPLSSELAFREGSVTNTISSFIEVSAHGLYECILSKNLIGIALPKILNIVPRGLEEYSVQCDLLLTLSEMEKLISFAFCDSDDIENDGLQEKVMKYDVRLDRVSAAIRALYLVSEELLSLRLGHKGYPLMDLECYDYPNAWKVVNGLRTYANSEGVKVICKEHRNKLPLKVQHPSSNEDLQAIRDICPLVPPFLIHPNLEGAPTKDAPFLLCESVLKQLISALSEKNYFTARQLLYQFYSHPYSGVAEALLKQSFPREEFTIKKFTSSSRKIKTVSIDHLMNNPELMHNGENITMTQYTTPFDSVFDIYVQHLLLQGLRKVTSDITLENISRITHFANLGSVHRSTYSADLSSLDIAISAQCSAICVEAFIQRVGERSLVLCYKDPAFQRQHITSVKIPLLSKSRDGTPLFKHFAKLTCIEGSLEAIKNPQYEIISQPSADQDDHLLLVYCPDENNGLMKKSLKIKYNPPVVCISEDSWTCITNFMERPYDGKTGGQLLHALANCTTELFTADCTQAYEDSKFIVAKSQIPLRMMQVVKVWIHADLSKPILTPQPAMIELIPGVRTCLLHSNDAQMCFSSGSSVSPSKLEYSSLKRYVAVWEEILLAEAAQASVQETDSIIFTDFPLKFSGFRIPKDCVGEQFYEPVGDISATIPMGFLSALKDIFPFEPGYLACIRYDIDLIKNKEDVLYQEYRKLMHPLSGTHACAVYHMVVVAIKPEDGNEYDEEDILAAEINVKSNYIVKFKVSGQQNVHISPLMKELLEKNVYSCELQLIPLQLSLRKIYHSLRKLPITDEGTLGESIALGRVEELTKMKSKVTNDIIRKLREKYPNMTRLWDSNRPLNVKQSEAVVGALQNKFQLVLGPPGTGKSLTGVHIAYAFAMYNRTRKKKEEKRISQEDGHKEVSPLECVLYCAPSNSSVETVLKMFKAVTGKQGDKIHILRIYGRSIERQDYPGPYKDYDIFGGDKKAFSVEDNCKSFALHHLVRTQSPLKDEILKLENSFRNSKASLPPSEERYRYRKLLIEAEESVIRGGNFDVVLCTCNEASSYRVHRNILPLRCIIDEASMCTEPETMAAVSSAKHVVLLGDHMQLTPVVKSEIARRNGMERSLFKRYVELFQKYYPGGCKHFICLETQYRMVEVICDVPSKLFYEQKLKAYGGLINIFDEDLKHFWPMGPERPFVFCDICGEEETSDLDSSKLNKVEAAKAVKLVAIISALVTQKCRIGILTPYRAQQKLIDRMIKDEDLTASVDTIDASQGSEFDIVILSMVRSKPRDALTSEEQVDRQWKQENLGFVTDPHRLCVALTRSKYGLIILGNKKLLRVDDTWDRLLKEYEYYRFITEDRRFPPAKAVRLAERVGRSKKFEFDTFRKPDVTFEQDTFTKLGVSFKQDTHKKPGVSFKQDTFKEPSVSVEHDILGELGVELVPEHYSGDDQTLPGSDSKFLSKSA